jgi:hypothetical protein
MPTCEQIEILLCDYLDGTLAAARRAEVETHLATCGACTSMRQDIEALNGFLAQTAEPETPPELLPRILFHLPTAPRVPEKAPWWRNWLAPLMQPRLVMGMAMTVLSFSMIARLAGVEPRQLTMNDLEPARVWAAVDWKLHRTWDRALKYYDNLRLVYDVQTRLEEWTAAGEEQAAQAAQEGAAQPIDITPRPAARQPEKNNGGGRR